MCSHVLLCFLCFFVVQKILVWLSILLVPVRLTIKGVEFLLSVQ